MIFFASGRGLLVAQALGLARPAPPKLREIAEGVAARVGIQLRGVHELDWHAPNALAYPLLRRIAFTQRALEVLDEAEIEAVCAHEVGHLVEPRRISVMRAGMAMLFWPLVLVIPLSLRHGPLVILGVLLVILVGATLFRRVARKMEEHADHVAHDHGNESGVYARALETIHRANLIPAVMPRGRAVHPNLYDRMLAAGVTPDQPRPDPPSRWRRVAVYAVPMVIAFGLFGTLRIGLILAGSLVPISSIEEMTLGTMAISGGDAGDLSQLAEVYLARGDHDDALIFSRASLAASDDGAVRYAADHARVLSELGRCSGAWVALAEAQRRAGPSPSDWDRQDLSMASEAATRCRASAAGL
jgi:hypothetical protein